MAKLVITFADTDQHVYENVPEEISQEQALQRVQKDFPNKKVTNISRTSEAVAPTPVQRMGVEDVIAPVPRPKQKLTFQASDLADLPRQLGLTARAGITGAAQLPALLAEPIAQFVNIGAGKQLVPNQMQGLQNLLTQLGLPEPQTPVERISQDVGSAMAGVAAPYAALKNVPSPLAKMFTESPEAQATAALSSAAASSIAREGGASPFTQGVLGIVGSMAPGGKPIGQAAARGAKEVVRPFTEQGREVMVGNVLRNLSREPETAIQSAQGYVPRVQGYTPTTAQATRDVGLIAAETPIRGMDTYKFAEQVSQANQARMTILDRMAKDQDAVTKAIKKRDEVTTPLREKAFAQASVDPDTFQSAITLNVGGTIDNILQSPAGARGSVSKTMEWAKAQLQRAKTPEELYEVRKDLRDAAQGLLDKEGSAYSLAKGQLETVIRSVDDVIDSAAPGYKDYLRKYAASSKGIESLESAQRFRGKVLTTTPDPMNVGDYMISQPAFTRAVRALENDPQGLSKTQIAVLKKVGQDLDDGVLMRAGKVPGSDTFKNFSTANLIGAVIGKQVTGLPPALQKTLTPLNWLYNGTDDQIRELLVDAMLDPKLASQLMAKANVMTVEPLEKELRKRAIALGYGSSFGLSKE